MPGTEARRRSFLVLHGWGGSGPEHWQTWLANRLHTAGETVHYPLLPDPDDPVLDRWLAALCAELDAMPGERTVICHSLAALLWLHHAQSRDAGSADRLLLVAPPGPSANNPQVATFFPPPLDAAALQRSARTIMSPRVTDRGRGSRTGAAVARGKMKVGAVQFRGKLNTKSLSFCGA